MAVLLAAGCHAPGGWGRVEQAGGPAETLAGVQAADAVEASFGGVVHDTAAEQRFARVLGAMVEHLGPAGRDGRVQLLASDQVNALSMPGGRVYITRGLYARLQDDDLIAAVLAHEFAHLNARDHYKPRCRNPEESLDREMAADTLAVTYLEPSGIRPSAMADVIRIIADVQPAQWVERRVGQLERVNQVAVRY
jgi:predicted Zn-dependent protease